VPRLFELLTALLEYLNLFQGDCSPPAPQGCYTYMIMKMIEIYNTAIIAGESMHTTSKQSHPVPHLRIYRLKEDWIFIASYVQPIIQQYKSTTV